MPKKTVILIPYFLPDSNQENFAGNRYSYPESLNTENHLGSINDHNKGSIFVSKTNSFLNMMLSLTAPYQQQGSETIDRRIRSLVSDPSKQVEQNTCSSKSQIITNWGKSGKLNGWRLADLDKQHSLVKQVEVRFVRLQYPYLDSLILAKYLAINSDKYSFSRMQKSLFGSAPTVSINSVVPETSNYDGRSEMPIKQVNQDRTVTNNVSAIATEVQSLSSWGLSAQLTGIKLELAGRLTTQRSIPRKTVDNTYTGTFSAPLTRVVSKKQNKSLDFRQYASKNKLGAFTVKTWISAKIK